MSRKATSGTVRDDLPAWLWQIAESYEVALSPWAASSLARFALRLLEWNERINLSGARDLETLLREHVADALALVRYLPTSGRCLDVGSGAGLPGIILAIVRPDLSFELLEPSNKRRAFLAAICRELALANVSIGSDRLETHSVGGSRYDFAVSRAVFPINEWLVKGEGLVRAGGVVVGLCGGAPPCGLPPAAEIHPYDTGAGPRTVVVLRK